MAAKRTNSLDDYSSRLFFFHLIYTLHLVISSSSQKRPKVFDCQHFDLMCQTIADFKERHVLSVLGPALTILFSLFFFVRHPTEGNLYKLEEAASLVY